LSSPTDETGSTLSGDDADVGEHRSEKYRQQARLAGKEINLARERANWSQEELARRCGLTKSDISRFEAGKVLEMSVGRFFDMCEALTLDPVYVWTGKTRRSARQSDRPPAQHDLQVESGERPSQRPKRS
jgi:transcriptional regulator with XRE-family HTH domain